MLPTSNILIVLVALVASVVGLPEGLTHGYLSPRDLRTSFPFAYLIRNKRSDPTVADLLTSCPTSSSKKKIPKTGGNSSLILPRQHYGSGPADDCIWTETGKAGKLYTARKYLYHGDKLDDFTNNCDPGNQEDRVITVTGGTYFKQKFEVDRSIGLDLGPYSRALSRATGHYTIDVYTDHSNMTLAPNQKGTIIAFQAYQPARGTIQINYPNRVAGHYIWYVYNVGAQLLYGEPSTGPVVIGCKDKIPDIPH